MPVALVALFALVAWLMIPIGELVASYFDRLERIPAYSINVAGSLLGVLAFSAASLLRMPALLRFACGLGMLWLLTTDRINLAIGRCVLGLLVALHLRESKSLRASVSWSPYYKVVAQPPHARGGGCRVCSFESAALWMEADRRRDDRGASGSPSACFHSGDRRLAAPLPLKPRPQVGLGPWAIRTGSVKDYRHSPTRSRVHSSVAQTA
jgi:hypothetical protein